jgi:hypothetical protein
VDSPLRSIIFANSTQLFFSPQPNAEGELQFVVNQLNASIEAMGMQVGDVLLGMEGERFPEINQENGGKINALLTPSIGWEANKIVSFTVARDGEELELSGKVGTPTATAKGLLEDPAAAESTVELRKAWLYN